jgi:hypothetical protein
MSLKTDSGTIFSREKEPKINGKIYNSRLLISGKYEHSFSLKRSRTDKPTHISPFILAYARKLMNNLIRDVGEDNVYYGDTDSIYVPIECLNKIKQSKDLGGFKNDYGEGLLIEKAIFLDTKRYLLKFNKPDKYGNVYKSKFNGINFKNNNCLKNWDTNNELSEYEKTLKLYEWFYNNPNTMTDIKIIQERWMRNNNCVVINNDELQYQVNPNVRNNWIGNEAYPIKLLNNEIVKYDIENTVFTKLGEKTKTLNIESFNFKCSSYGLFSAMPLCLRIKRHITLDEIVKSFSTSKIINIKFMTSFVKCKKTNKIYKSIKNRSTQEYDFYEYDNYTVKNKMNMCENFEYDKIVFFPYDILLPIVTNPTQLSKDIIEVLQN